YICLQSSQLTMAQPRDPDINYGYEDFSEFDWGKSHQAELYRQQLRFERVSNNALGGKGTML
ncbi:MAG: hypothetical protein RIR39_1961, partial [Pseudomonadota bacterium]